MKPTLATMTISNFDECVKFALTQKGISGEAFADTDLRVYNRRMANPEAAFPALRKHGIVIPAVKASIFGGTDDETTATVIVRANQVKKKVSLFNPYEKSVADLNIADFVSSWEATGGICTTAFPKDDNLYTPAPISTDNIAIPGGIGGLLEELARSNHDAWALERQSEGWTYGTQRDDDRLETPDMVPYDKLPESEKQYDRIMASQTIKQLIALGYKVEKV